ncbi:hypothetical protein COUCH_21940 [Couchioplanes caeruleus]|uniref:hypothetical protein n=1 Tax=Couchioplanes caeruleus TaxID=56438 RepID=UPI0020BDAC8C|nr:hypothetical protein [Couchioplanes caeruleus]UQU61703.1 hypothetical protein COUCH_21940 [Couchioplanes caeruleus]
MTPRTPGRLAATAMSVAAAALPGAGCADDLPGRRDCTATEKAQVATLERLAILEQHPAGAQPAAAYAGCGTDDSGDRIRPYAGRRYRSAVDEPAIRSFYWEAMTADGWRNASTDIPPDVAPSLAFQRGIACLVKDVDGSETRIGLTFGPAEDAYAVEVTSGLGETC